MPSTPTKEVVIHRRIFANDNAGRLQLPPALTMLAKETDWSRRLNAAIEGAPDNAILLDRESFDKDPQDNRMPGAQGDAEMVPSHGRFSTRASQPAATDGATTITMAACEERQQAAGPRESVRVGAAIRGACRFQHAGAHHRRQGGGDHRQRVPRSPPTATARVTANSRSRRPDDAHQQTAADQHRDQRRR